MIENVGIVDVGFGQQAPAAVYAAGVALTFRDIVQRTLGREAAIVAILLGTAVSLLFAPMFAFASATAFLAAELADFAVYTPIAERSFLLAVLISNTVGLVIDSMLFLWPREVRELPALRVALARGSSRAATGHRAGADRHGAGAAVWVRGCTPGDNSAIIAEPEHEGVADDV
ncbi:MAG: hypothetical protein ACRDMZ_06875 [Solirubrobacteraceae bacterium]